MIMQSPIPGDGQRLALRLAALPFAESAPDETSPPLTPFFSVATHSSPT